MDRWPVYPSMNLDCMQCRLISNEELFYRRIFKERFGLLKNLDWKG